jgi:hypothetical protein
VTGVVPRYAGADQIVAAFIDMLASPAMGLWIAAIARDRADGVPLPAGFDRVVDHEIDPETVADHALATVLVPRVDRDPRMERSTDDATTLVVVGVVMTGDDASQLTKQIQRMLVAVREIIKSELTTVLPWLSVAGPVLIGAEDYQPTALLPGDANVNILIKAGTIDVFVPTIS